MIDNLKNLIHDNKGTIVTGIIVLLLVTIYPTIFKNIYETGRDFGRSVVNMLFP